MARPLRFLTPLALAATFTATALPAQATWIVDSMGNFDFLTIQAAVNASSPGDIIIVLGHPGTVYPAFTTTIGVNVQGRNDPVVAMATVQNVPAGQRFTMECIRIQPAGITIVDCRGTSHLERIGPACGASGCMPAPRLAVLRSRLVSAGECVLGAGSNPPVPAVFAESCDLVLTECSAAGADAGAQQATPALAATSARVFVAGGSWFGGSESALQPAAPAIDASSGVLEVNGARARLLGGRLQTPAPAIRANGGRVRVDPRVTLQPSSTGVTIAGSSQVTTVDIPFSRITVNAPGSNMVTGTTNFPGDLVVQVLGLPNAGSPIPVMTFGDLWLDPTLLVTVGVGVADGQGRFLQVLPTPGSPLLEGQVFGLQALVVPSAGAPPALSNPAFGIMTSCAVTD